MQRHANRQPLWHLTVKGWLYQQQILKIGERLKMHNTPVNRQYQKSKETCPYCLGRRHQFCTLCKEAGVRLKRWAGGKMNDNLAPTKPGMNVTGGWGQEVHRVKTQKSVCGRAIPSPDLLHRWLFFSHGWKENGNSFSAMTKHLCCQKTRSRNMRETLRDSGRCMCW